MKKIVKIIAVIAIVCIVIAGFVYVKYMSGNVKQDSVLYIPTNATYTQVLDSLKNKVEDIESFKTVASKMDLEATIKAGRYELKSGDGNLNIIRKIKAGNQDEVKLAILNYADLPAFAKKVSKKLEMDSADVMKGIQAVAQERQVNDLEAIKAMIIPNTYNFYWNVQPKDFIEKLLKEYDAFWTDERKNLAKKQNLSPLQVTTLASIIQKESSKEDEYKRIAGLYLNRLNKGIKLQSDPTVIYAKKKIDNNTVIKRVLNKDLAIDSDYNTYKVVGLPPYPICIPSIAAIEAVLEPENHSFIYMCAQTNYTGHHDFTESYVEHEANAVKYRKWLDSEGIKR